MNTSWKRSDRGMELVDSNSGALIAYIEKTPRNSGYRLVWTPASMVRFGVNRVFHSSHFKWAKQQAEATVALDQGVPA